MDDSNVNTPHESRNHTPKLYRPRRESLEGLPWPTAWEKHRRLAEVMEAQEEAEEQPDSRRK